jgi:hypothetical protein
MKDPNKKRNNYVDKEHLMNELIKYHEKLNYSKKNNLKLPNIPDSIGIAITKIAKNYANCYSFRNYSFKDEMIDDAVVACIKAVDGFDVTRSKEPLSFFTTCCYFAFLQRIEAEDKQRYIKYKRLVFDNTMDFEETEEENNAYNKMNIDNMNEFIQKYEIKIKNKKDKTKKSKEDIDPNE